MKRYIFLFFQFLFIQLTQETIASSNGKLVFIENKGQWPNEALFKAGLGNGSVFITKDGFVFNIYDGEKVHQQHEAGTIANTTDKLAAHAFRYRFKNSTTTSVTSRGKKQQYYNFIKGTDPEKWVGHAAGFETITLHNFYPNTDLVVNSEGNNLKYDFILKPGSDVKNIKMMIEGSSGFAIADQQLQIKTSFSEIIESIPLSYTISGGKITPVEINYSVVNEYITYATNANFHAYDSLIIDPLLQASTYSGSSGTTYGSSATYDHQGNLIIGAMLFDTGWPYTLGAYDLTYGGAIDMGITKFDSTASNQLWSTYLGGSSQDVVLNLATNSNDELFVFGYSFNNYPVTGGAFDQSPNGENDLVISKLSTDGSQLLASTYVGGAEDEGRSLNLSMNVHSFGDLDKGEIYIDSQGNVVVGSLSASTNFPVTTGAYQLSNGGSIDAVLFKMDAALSNLIFSTYLGGSGEDACYGFCIDKNGDFVLTGGTNSINFPVSAGAYQPNYGGGLSFQFDSFISKINSSGSSLLASTYFGYNNGKDKGYKTDVDTSNNIYVFGNSEGTLPVSTGVFSNQNSGNYVLKFDPTLNNLMLCTSYGDGSNTVNIQPIAFHIDPCNQIYCAGFTSSVLGTLNAFPVTANAQQSLHNGTQDFHIMVFAPDFASMVYGSHLGGAVREHTDAGSSKFDDEATLYLGVCTEESFAGGFPTLQNAFSPTSQTPDWDMAGVKWKFDLCSPPTIAPIAGFNFTTMSNCDSACILVNSTATGPMDTLIWLVNSQYVSSDTLTNFCFTSGGNFLIQQIVCNAGICDTSSQNIVLNIPLPLAFSLGSDTTLCLGDSVVLFGPSGGVIYTWSEDGIPVNNSQNTIAFQTANYSLQVTDSNGCISHDTVTIQFNNSPNVDFNFTLQPGCFGVLLEAVSTTANVTLETWSGTDGISGNGNTLEHIYTQSGNYTLLLTAYNGNCVDTLSKEIDINEYSILSDTIPTIITPNGDGINECMRLNISDLYTSCYSLSIFNRWGAYVFESKEPSNCFEGKSGDGNDLPEGVYFYILQVGIEKVKGTISIYR
ncbi:MAG: gliding motility-associated C-terminal domain-containing protein [Bacteroidetes bacterium]|nr:gliding motility-associated C-terminal domain-containing protein [Bacteroidota bacterium]